MSLTYSGLNQMIITPNLFQLLNELERSLHLDVEIQKEALLGLLELDSFDKYKEAVEKVAEAGIYTDTALKDAYASIHEFISGFSLHGEFLQKVSFIQTNGSYSPVLLTKFLKAPLTGVTEDQVLNVMHEHFGACEDMTQPADISGFFQLTSEDCMSYTTGDLIIQREDIDSLRRLCSENCID